MEVDTFSIDITVFFHWNIIALGLPRWHSGKKIRLPIQGMQKTQVQSLAGRYQEEEMATHSSILAWKIPWMEEPGEFQCWRLQRVRHD